MIIFSRLQLLSVLLCLLREVFLSRDYKIHFEFGLKFSFCSRDDNSNTLPHKISAVKLLFSFKFILALFKAYPIVEDEWFQLI